MKQLACFLLLCLVLMFGCSANSEEYYPAFPRTISAVQAQQLMADGEAFILVDVREAAEFAAGHIEGAILIPIAELRYRAPEELPDSELRILVYCRSGRRSAEAAQTLIELGYSQVYDLGGILDWPY